MYYPLKYIDNKGIGQLLRTIGFALYKMNLTDQNVIFLYVVFDKQYFLWKW